ncbi:MAG TPA: ribosome maturation factor RimM [Burkholderiaceae bacterium]|nr:ribosome maturation factor RimM [Burkholderiaceae bacterium]
MPERIALGRVAGAYGLRGWIKVVPYGSAADSALLQTRDWQLARSGAEPLALHLTIERARCHGAAVVAKIAGIDERDGAERLKGAEVRIKRIDFPPLADDEYYWVDLIGCEVINPDGQPLGRVVSVDDHGAHAILELDGGVLIPFVSVYIVSVDLGARRIVADWQADY